MAELRQFRVVNLSVEHSVSRCEPVSMHVAGKLKCAVSQNCRRVCRNPCRSIKKRGISSPDGSHGFTYYDTDQDGEITKRELANVLNLTEENVQKYFGIFDIDEDGQITRDEFYTMTAPSYEIDQ